MVPAFTRSAGYPLAPVTIDASPPDVDSDPVAFVLGGSGGLRRRQAGALGAWAGIALIAALVAIPLRGLYKFTGGSMEEGFMLYFPELVRRGRIPNVDFLHLYGPGSLEVLALWYRVAGNTLASERTFGLLQHLGIIFALYALARPWGRLAATAVGTLAVFYVLTPVGLTAMAWNGGLALTLWAAVFALRAVHAGGTRQRQVGAALTGVLGGLALTYRPDLAVAVAAILVWLFVAMRRRDQLVAWKLPLVGALVGLTPMWAHLARAGLRASWQGMVIDPVVELRPGRELPVPPSWNYIDGALQRIAEGEPPWWPFPSLPAEKALFLWFFAMILIAVGMLAFGIWLRWRGGRRDVRSSVVLVSSLVSVALLSQGMQRPDSAHLLWVTCVPWPLLVVTGAEVARSIGPRLRLRQALIAGAAAALLVTYALTSLFTFRYYILHMRVGLGQVPSAFEVSRHDRSFRFGDWGLAVSGQGVIDDLDRLSSPGERLLVAPADMRRTWYNDLVFYWLFPELEPATYYIEMDPGLANAEGSSLADDVASADWLILTNFWWGWDEPNASMEFGSDAPNRVVAEQFCLVSSYENDLAMLFERCDRRPDWLASTDS